MGSSSLRASSVTRAEGGNYVVLGDFLDLQPYLYQTLPSPRFIRLLQIIGYPQKLPECIIR